MNQGNADVYKAFTWRFWDLGRWGGAVGVVLPRSALSGKGSEEWRRTVLGQGSFEDVTVTTNRGGWVFDDAEHRYTIALVSLRSGPEYAGAIHLRGPYNSLAAFRVGTESKPAEIAVDEFLTWSDGASFPLLPSEESVDVFAKLRAHPSLGSAEQPWRARPIQGDLNATTGKKHLVLDAEGTDGLWPVYKGASFNLWEPDTGTYYAWADPGYITEVLQEKRIRGRRSAIGVQ
ncbi:MAG: hypothetical protein M5U31_16190 [Acidimicrobiia bacterium]|nr:hypothetical protein [Acidimicrobiia bacterium]